ncbi:DNA gyrase inhibitor YacG [Sphingorhabdus arenilitoris]|uniref:DNA gyrase inhibitor YacG n=1 Tax=Sphingorhabdus arenilitoris TaxID=1490041 RepID=A0ABV8RGG1_9SPHN
MPNKSLAKCPVCKKPASAESKPFCGQGCKDRDLLQWLGEGYRVPGPPADYADSLGLDEKD